MTGSGSKRKEPDKGTWKSRTRDPEKRTGNEKKENKMDKDVCFRRVTRKGTLNARKITKQRK
jgi:hypothetical protein